MMMPLQLHFQASDTSSAGIDSYTGLPSVNDDDKLNSSPRLSYNYSHIGKVERTMLEQSTSSSSAHASKSAEELINEIATLDMEIVNLERHLLSLYRNALVSHQTNSPYRASDKSSKPQVEEFHSQPALQDISLHSNDISITKSMNQYKRSISVQDPKRTSKTDRNKATFRYRSLADHFGTSLIDHVPKSPHVLSEDIIRCISSIYCKLANPPLPSDALTDSPTSSLSSTNTFSPTEFHNNWSPQCSEESTVNLGSSLKNGPYAEMIEVPKIWLDDDRFNYASTMLQSFKSLVQRLEKVEPLKMTREEKLAFWINIYNALWMHAYLAYGMQNNRMKSSSLIQKASYNIGGHSINAFIIQNSILGCIQRRSTSWLQTLFSSAGQISDTDSDKHPYALDYPEPLVHFTLSSGANSDPAVRVYTAKNIFHELKLAKHDFIEASVTISSKGGKIILPKILHYYARDASLNLEGLVEMIHPCISSKARQNEVEKLLKGSISDKYIEWSPYNSGFRYIIHRDLAKVKA